MIKEIINSIYPISHDSLKEIESSVEFSTIKKGSSFIKANKRNNKEYFVLEGICGSYLNNDEGKDITITFLTNKSIISPFSMRTENEYSLLNFQALTELKIATIDSKYFEKLMLENEEIRLFGNTLLHNELKRKVAKEIRMASSSVKERLLSFRIDFPDLENKIPHTIIASYLGITSVSLSRSRGELVE